MSNKKKRTKKPTKKKKTGKPSFTKHLTDWWQGRSTALRFLSLFAVMIGGFYAFYFSNFNMTHIHPHIINAQAKIGAFLLRIMGQTAQATNEVIDGSEFSMSVAIGCDGMEVTALLIAAILAFPSSWKEKGKGLLYGLGILTVLNLLRLPMLYFAGAKGSTALFDFLHVQGGFIIFVSITLLIWGYWIINILNERRLAAEQSAANPSP